MILNPPVILNVFSGLSIFLVKRIHCILADYLIVCWDEFLIGSNNVDLFL